MKGRSPIDLLGRRVTAYRRRFGHYLADGQVSAVG
jgi:hypothetical protein